MRQIKAVKNAHRALKYYRNKKLNRLHAENASLRKQKTAILKQVQAKDNRIAKLVRRSLNKQRQIRRSQIKKSFLSQTLNMFTTPFKTHDELESSWNNLADSIQATMDVKVRLQCTDN
jgi:hypothetical protein